MAYYVEEYTRAMSLNVENEGGSPGSPENVPVTSFRQLQVAWGVTGLLFLLFNLLWWPAEYRRLAADPERFPEQAKVLSQSGQRDQAIRLLEEGLSRFHPPAPEPWNAYAGLVRGPAKLQASLRAGWLTWRREQGEPGQLLDLTRKACTAWPCCGWTPTSEELPSTLARSWRVALGLPDTVTLAPRDLLALAWLSGGRVSCDGMIGATGFLASELLVAWSPGSDRQTGVVMAVGNTLYTDARRGMHVALLRPGLDHPAPEFLHFDFWDGEETSRQFVQRLRSVPVGTVALFAVTLDSRLNFTDEAEACLAEFGIPGEAWENGRLVSFGLRHAFCAIGARGAPAGSAMAAWSPHSWRGVPGHPVCCVVIPERLS
ncbi:MAG: hypothetical protein KBH78_01610 [Candidatus Hydrogenedentes bacterium]|nr:hypothetical protein [Candidatus Hydrogenedentota bacterium]